MSEQERRWLDNAKKAFFESDRAYVEGRAADQCLPELCKAVDVAKTLRRSLRGEDVSSRENKKRFLEFLECEMPSPKSGGLQVDLVDARSGNPITYSFAELVYAVRCNGAREREPERCGILELPHSRRMVAAERCLPQVQY